MHKKDTCRDDGEEKEKPFPWKKFLVKRFARLGPMYYLTNLMALPMSGLNLDVLPSLICTLLGVTSWIVLIEPPNGVMWTISTMAFFYLVFPCLVPRLQRLRTAKNYQKLLRKMYWLQLIVALVLFVLAIGLYLADLNSVEQDEYDDYASDEVYTDHDEDSMFELDGSFFWVWRVLPFSRLPCFVMGCCVAMLRLSIEEEKHERLIPLRSLMGAYSPQKNADVYFSFFLVCIVLCAVVSVYAEEFVLIIRWLGEAAFPIVFTDLCFIYMSRGHKNIDSLMPFSWSERFFRTRAMKYMGKISFSFYALHELVMMYFCVLVFDGEAYETPMPMWGVIAVLLLSLLFGALFTHLVEIPLQKCILRCVYPTNNARLEAKGTPAATTGDVVSSSLNDGGGGGGDNGYDHVGVDGADVGSGSLSGVAAVKEGENESKGGETASVVVLSGLHTS